MYSSVVSLTILLFCVAVSQSDGRPSQSELTGSDRLIGNRAATQHTVELYIIADYSLYKLWYNRVDGNLDTTLRQTIAITNLKKYLGSMVNMADMTFRSLEQYDIYINIALIEIQVCTTASLSHWTEDIKIMNGTTYQVDGDIILDELTTTSAYLRQTKPHDLLMLVTAYDVITPAYGDILGIGVLSGVCENRRVSVVEDVMYVDTAHTMAHQLGLSLGARQDGNGNNCSSASNYLMTQILDESITLRGWTFSICSAGHITSNIRRLNGNANNCMTVINNPSPDHQLTEYTKLFFGDLYSADDQCRMVYGPGSYVCRILYNSAHPYRELCLHLKCKDPQDDICHQISAGDHTPCGDQKWCVLGECQSDPHAPVAIETCPLGESSEDRVNGHSCRELMKISPQECYSTFVQSQCCESCYHYHNSHVSLAKHPDVQCAEEFGSPSKFCYGARSYNKTFSGVCSHLFCDDVTNADRCVGMIAADGTPCGHGKWCFQSECVASSFVPDVPEDCLYGDTLGVVANGQTCADIIRDVPHHCLDVNFRRFCCTSCASIATNIPGCPYGDLASNNGCARLPMGGCYDGHNAQVCCRTCHALQTSYPGCEYGDRNVDCNRAHCAAYDQHTQEYVCCKSCHDYVSAIVG